MNIKNLLVYIFLLTYLQSFSQKTEKYYYDKNWKGIEKTSEAIYYRIVNYDINGKILGKVKDYYISGELQGEGEAAYIDTQNDALSKWIGRCIGYYKSGKKHFELLFNKEGEKLSTKECDETGRCQNIFFEDFSAKSNINKWQLTSSNNSKIQIIEGKGLQFETATINPVSDGIYLPIETNANFTIETNVIFEKGSVKEGQGCHGLYFGYKDKDNYYLTFRRSRIM